MSRSRIVKLTVSVLAATFLVAACGSGVLSHDSSDGYRSEPMDSQWSSSVEAGEPVTTDTAEVQATGDASTVEGADVIPSQVIVTGDATVRVEDSVVALAQVETWVEDNGGRVDTSNQEEYASSVRTWATVRVPADRYDALLVYLSELGTVTSKSTSRTDVGQQVADVEARIEALETSVERLTTLMEDATTTADLLEAERELTWRQADLDSLKSQRVWLADQVSLSTLNVTFTMESKPTDPDSNVFKDSWDAFASGMTRIGVALVMLAPWALVLLVIVLPIVALLRRRMKRRRVQRAAAIVAPEAGVGEVKEPREEV